MRVKHRLIHLTKSNERGILIQGTRKEEAKPVQFTIWGDEFVAPKNRQKDK